MTRHALDLQGKRDEEKPGEGGGEKEDGQRTLIGASGGGARLRRQRWRRNRSRGSPTAAARRSWSRGEAEAEKRTATAYGNWEQRKSVSVTGVNVSGAAFVGPTSRGGHRRAETSGQGSSLFLLFGKRVYSSISIRLRKTILFFLKHDIFIY
ncbi:unnamed protein product [Miscanthus lutarioriparius]|uniref:Uncharacterized protein n=1 Tax=Miscanthus lutarioriparius TaxID=422564 RepID=A0A811R2T4_9POAL|nr:unnamed protein product [Miscanthus lutarioriparius]